MIGEHTITAKTQAQHLFIRGGGPTLICARAQFEHEFRHQNTRGRDGSALGQQQRALPLLLSIGDLGSNPHSSMKLMGLQS